MKPSLSHRLLTCCILCYALWNARDLGLTWLNSPYDTMGWLAFFIWICAPLSVKALRLSGDLRWLAASLIVTILGVVADIHAFFGVSLALALAGLVVPGSACWLWTMAFVCWTPALGWLLQDFPTSFVVVIRLSIALISWWPWLSWKHRPV